VGVWSSEQAVVTTSISVVTTAISARTGSQVVFRLVR